jgi:DNA-directed RNA polymerase subunit F
VPLKISENKLLTHAKAREILRNLGRELNQFQKKTLEYLDVFSKVNAEDAEKLVEELVSSFDLEVKEAVQIVNCMPESVEELRVFFPRYKLIPTEKLQEMLSLLDKYRK